MENILYQDHVSEKLLLNVGFSIKTLSTSVKFSTNALEFHITESYNAKLSRNLKTNALAHVEGSLSGYKTCTPRHWPLASGTGGQNL